MRDYTLCPTYLIIIKYYSDGKWKTITDKYDGYDLDEAIEQCKQEFDYEFTYKWGRIDRIYQEKNSYWDEIDW